MIDMNNNTIRNLVNLIISQNNSNVNNSFTYSHNQFDQVSFLQKKRNLNFNYLNYNEQILYPKNNHFILSNMNYIKVGELINNKSNVELDTPLKRATLINNKNNNCNCNSIQLELNNKINNNYLDSIKKENKIVNYIDINRNKSDNKCKLIVNNKLIDSHKNLFNIIKINENSENNNSTDSTSPISIKNNTTFNKKIKFFNVFHLKNEKPRRKKIKTRIRHTESNNEIKVLKNNKVVYVNNFLLNSYSTAKNIKELNKIAFIGRNKRSSRYRGVSKNGNQWQVLMMINKNKSYIGSYPSEEYAARVYDILAIKNRGIKARTNFIYNSKQIKKICEIDIDIKSKNLYEIISQLIV